MIVQLSKEGKQDLYPSNGMNGTVDGVSHCGFHILRARDTKAIKQLYEDTPVKASATEMTEPSARGNGHGPAGSSWPVA